MKNTKEEFNLEFAKVRRMQGTSTINNLLGKATNLIPQEEPKQEWIDNNPQCKQIESCSKSLSKKCICPKEQGKKMYSEEDMIAFGNKMQLVSDVDFDGNVKFAFDPSEAIKQFYNK